MLWISYSVTFVLASAIAMPFIAIRLVLSAAGRVFRLIPPGHRGNAASRKRVVSALNRHSSSSIWKAD
jgi:hypothetical protein